MLYYVDFEELGAHMKLEVPPSSSPGQMPLTLFRMMGTVVSLIVLCAGSVGMYRVQLGAILSRPCKSAQVSGASWRGQRTRCSWEG